MNHSSRTPQGRRRGRKAALAFFGAGLLAGPGLVHADDWQSLEAQAQAQAARGNHEHALQLYSQAFGAYGPKELLIRMGETYNRLGQPGEARRACQAYLTQVQVENQDGQPTQRAAAEQCIAEAARTPERPRRPPPLLSPAPSTAAPSTASVVTAPVSAPQAAPATKPAAPTPAPTPAAIATAKPRNAAPPTAPPPPAPTPVAALAPTPPPPLAPPPTPPAPPPVVAATPAPTATAYAPVAPPAAITPAPTAYARAQPVPAAAVTAPAATSTGRNNDAMFGAGLSMLFCAMVPPIVLGPIFAQGVSPDRKPIYYTLMIPIAGPFVSGIWLPSISGNPKEYIINHTVPWIVADGITQIAGLIMTIVGGRARPVAAHAASGPLSTLRVMPYSSGNSFGIAGSF